MQNGNFEKFENSDFDKMVMEEGGEIEMAQSRERVKNGKKKKGKANSISKGKKFVKSVKKM